MLVVCFLKKHTQNNYFYDTGVWLLFLNKLFSEHESIQAVCDKNKNRTKRPSNYVSFKFSFFA